MAKQNGSAEPRSETLSEATDTSQATPVWTADGLPEFAPLVDQSKVWEWDRIADGFGFGRRVTLLVLTRSSAELIERCKNEDEGYIELMERVANFKEHAAGLAGAAEQAWARLALVAGAVLDHQEADGLQEETDVAR